MKKIKLLRTILKYTGANKIVTGFVFFLLLCALLILWLEPGISNYGDALWYCFAVFTTTGFGDLTAVTLFGRIVSVLVALYGILVVALIPGVLVSYFTEQSRIRAKDSVVKFLDKLERLPELSKEELEEISKNVKKQRL